MASITPRYNKNGEIISYRVKVFCGYGSDGKQLTCSATYKPAKDLSKKEIQSELQKFTADFERKCSFGCGFVNPKLSDFIPETS